MRVVALGSGSAGNAIALTDGDTTLLVDAGLSAREISRRLAAAGIEAASISAILVTHEHGDHVRGIDVFLRRYAHEAALYATRGTLAAASGLGEGRERAVEVKPGDTFNVGSFEVIAFPTSHDAAQPVGYVFRAGGMTAGIATDTGVLSAAALEALGGCAVLGLETNHDIEMLERGPYPAHLKRRIRSHAGHLSNEDAAAALATLAHDGLTHVLALHRSRTNNTARLAGRSLESSLRRIGASARVSVASQDEICDSDPPQQTLFGD
ncbi:MAG TPA: MBL fold metallo-hydrolase [Coriobacteriia bacterium]|nr:MBL fold metallo-hydrolase [Coriobacteriia bacterium]